MKRVRWLGVILTAAIFFLAQRWGQGHGRAQDVPECPVFNALAQCSGLERDQVCYAAGIADPNNTLFSTTGNRAELYEVERLEIASDPAADAALLLKFQANLADGLPGAALITLGDVQIENRIPADQARRPATPVEVITLVGANLRSGPSTDYPVIASVGAGVALVADGLNANGDWLRVTYNASTLWVSRQTLLPDDALDALPSLTADLRSPMQDFRFTTGTAMTCDGALPSMLIIQGSQTADVEITVNGARIVLYSTAVLTTAEDKMNITVLDGGAALGGRPLGGGFTASVALNENGDISGGWSGFRALTQDELNALQILETLPLEVLNYAIDVPDNPVELVDCGGLQPISPLARLPYSDSVTFFWDGVREVTSYRLNIYDDSGALRFTFGSGFNNPNISIPTTAERIGEGSRFAWNVEALVGSRVVCSMARVEVVRDAPPAQDVPVGGGNPNPTSVLVTYTPAFAATILFTPTPPSQTELPASPTQEPPGGGELLTTPTRTPFGQPTPPPSGGGE